jgi:hypothetical protein
MTATSTIQRPVSDSRLAYVVVGNNVDMRYDMFMAHWKDFLNDPLVFEMYTEFEFLKNECRKRPKEMLAKDIVNRMIRNHGEWCVAMQAPAARENIRKIEATLREDEKNKSQSTDGASKKRKTTDGKAIPVGAEDILDSLKDIDFSSVRLVTFEEVRNTLNEGMNDFATEFAQWSEQKWFGDAIDCFRLGIIQTTDPGDRTAYDIQTNTFLAVDGIILQNIAQRLPRPGKTLAGFAAATDYLHHVLIRHFDTHPQPKDHEFDNGVVAACINGILMLRNPQGKSVQEIVAEVLVDVQCARMLEIEPGFAQMAGSSA